ncbi:hypothetical protein EDC94DRAFT_594966 [Helicostylum pulchrum]|uniref:F-box domain-containing protein n=1 Tax=Helicostylum pulchrum TaxID=562976 RepID=A0ABP9XQ48_9FUNG|nr:hypothetical protein EDC94DRAFT_594966 [Helicostylum pulchrum]
MSNNLSQLPFELILKISQYLEFSDIWYLSTCSHPLRILSYNVLKQHYNIDLIRPRIINPLNNLVHAAVAYLGRHGTEHNSIQPNVLQSVANHMAMEIYDRLPSATDRVVSLDFLLDKTLSVLLDHCLSDPTLPPDNNYTNTGILSTTTPVPLDNTTQDEDTDTFGEKQTGVLMVDFLVSLNQNIGALFDTERADELHHRLLIDHLHRLLDSIKYKYHAYHITLSSYSRNTPQINITRTSHWDDLKSFTKVICALVKTNLVSAKDVEEIALYHINQFFLTRPSDVTLTGQDGFKIMIRNPNSNLMIVNSVTKHESPAFYYQWKLWLQETFLRLCITLDIYRSIIAKHGASPPDLDQLFLLLQETITAVSLSETVPEEDNNNTQNNHTISMY